MKVILIMTFIALVGNKVLSQPSYQNLIDSALAIGYPVYKKPLDSLGLKREDYKEYAYSFKIDYGIELDTAVVGQIIDNAQHMDKRSWRKREIRLGVLVKNAKQTISTNCVARHLKNLPPKFDTEFKEAVAHYNSQPVKKRNVFRYSKPVFSNNKLHAAIRYDSRYSYGVDLFIFENGVWRTVGRLISGGY